MYVFGIPPHLPATVRQVPHVLLVARKELRELHDVLPVLLEMRFLRVKARQAEVPVLPARRECAKGLDWAVLVSGTGEGLREWI